MIQRLSHVNIYVLDQNRALAFYVDKLGFEVRAGFTLGGGFRWLTVGPKGQPDLQLVLMLVAETPFMSSADAEILRGLINRVVLTPDPEALDGLRAELHGDIWR